MAVGWQQAKKAAWKQFGRRYWKLIVGVDMARKFGPAILAGCTVAVLAWGVWWLVSHADSINLPTPDVSVPGVGVPGRWWWWLIGILTLVAAVLLVRRVRRDPLAPTLRHRPAAVVARVVAALAVAGAVLLLFVTRDA